MASEEEMYVVSWPPDDMITIIIKIILLLLLLTTTTVRGHGPKRRMIVFLEISSLQDGMVFYGCGPVIGLI